MLRTYSEVIRLPTLQERFEYCKLDGRVGQETFGSYRRLNQIFYTSSDWAAFKEEIAKRDNFCELAHPDWEIGGTIYIHHLNPLIPEDFLMHSSCMLDPENVITLSYDMHQAITYGLEFPVKFRPMVIRRPNDTVPWMH